MYKWIIKWEALSHGTKVIGYEAFKTKKDAVEYEKEAKTGGRIIEMPAFEEYKAYVNEMMTASNQAVKHLPIQKH